MTDAEFVAFREAGEDGYAQQIAESGSMSWADAVQKASADFGRLLPGGLHTPGQFLWTAYDGAAPVGHLWLQIEGGAAFVYDIEVRADQRRHGYGRAIMLAGEVAAREAGATTMGLNVFGQNAGARSLYEQLDYQVTSVQMRKTL